MFVERGTHVCTNCGEEFTWSVFVREGYEESEQTVTMKCLCCGEKQKWIQRIERKVA